jgi:hypothetical protein
MWGFVVVGTSHESRAEMYTSSSTIPARVHWTCNVLEKALEIVVEPHKYATCPSAVCNSSPLDNKGVVYCRFLLQKFGSISTHLNCIRLLPPLQQLHVRIAIADINQHVHGVTFLESSRSSLVTCECRGRPWRRKSAERETGSACLGAGACSLFHIISSRQSYPQRYKPNRPLHDAP